MGCYMCTKYILLVFNLMIWLSGGVFLSCGILVLYKHDLNDLFKLFSYDSLLMPFHSIGYILIAIGILVFIVGLLGCCGSVRESRLLLSFYVFLIIIIMAGQLIVAVYTVLLSDQWNNQIPNTLKRRILNYNYSISQEFEHDLNRIHKQFSCCGIDGPSDFHGNSDYQINNRQLPSSCCNRLSNGACIEIDSHHLGCYQTINDYIYFYSRIIVASGILLSLLELTVLLLAIGVCRNKMYETEFD